MPLKTTSSFEHPYIQTLLLGLEICLELGSLLLPSLHAEIDCSVACHKVRFACDFATWPPGQFEATGGDKAELGAPMTKLSDYEPAAVVLSVLQAELYSTKFVRSARAPALGRQAGQVTAGSRRLQRQGPANR